MKKRLTFVLAIVMLIPFVVLANSWAFEPITREVIEEQKIEKEDMIKTTDNLIVVFDGSKSTNEMVPGTNISKITAAKEMLKERNEWMPDLGYNCGLFLTSGWSALKTVQEVQPCNREVFGRAIDQLPEKGEGNDLLVQAMMKIEKIVEPLSGRTSIIWFTDGFVTEQGDIRTPAEIAQRIDKEKDVRFYVVSSATDEKEKEMIDSVASINSGSRVIPLVAYLENPSYHTDALFTVKRSAYSKLVPKTEVIGFVAKDMLFDFDSDDVRSEYAQKLDELAQFLKEHPNATAVVQGHTDSSGPEEYNLDLSAKRASQVKDYLVNKYNIDADRVVALWHGAENPIADNATAEGRKMNRRVEIAVRTMK